jgi:hypothetical protein
MAASMYRVMLAGPSLLYAPLYLAKIERLSYAYPWVNFCYPTLYEMIGHEEGQHDPVYYKLLSPIQDHNVVLAVADPFRLRYKKATGHEPSTAVVVGGLIQRTCLWLVSDRNGFDLAQGDYKDHFNQIIVHRKEMTSYALMRALLKAHSVTDQDADKLLFYNARIGEEHVWARLRPHRNSGGRKLPFAYLTGDRNHAIERYSRRALTVAFFDHPTDVYKNVFFTGLVTTQQHWRDNKDLIEELIDGVKKAIIIIYDDPRWAAKCLIRDALLRRLLPGDQTETQIEDYLRALTAIEAYVKTTDLKVTQQVFDNGYAIHEAAHPVNAPAGVVAKADLNGAFSNVIGTGPSITCAGRNAHHVDPSETEEHPSFPLFTWTGVALAVVVSIFSLARVAAAGNSSFIAHSVVKPFANWLDANHIVGSKAYKFFDWTIDSWIAAVTSFVALVFLLPSLNEFLAGKSDKVGRNLAVFFASTAAVMSLIFTLADWNTTVGALCNWAVVCFAFYKFARRFWINSPRKRLLARWTAGLLFVNRICHAVAELNNRSNLCEPLPMRRLWRLLPKSQ